VLVRVYINMCVQKISKKHGGREDDTNLYVYTWICYGTVSSNKSNHQSTLVSEHRLCGLQLEQAMDRVDWSRTSADERVLSVQRAVVMVWWAAVGFGCSAFTIRFFANSHVGHLQTGPLACSPTGALLHCCLSSNLSTTIHGATVKLRDASLELYTLNLNQCWDRQTALARSLRTFLRFLGRGEGRKRGIEVSGNGYNEVLVLEVLNVVDCVKQRRRAEPPASASAPRAVNAAPSFQACLHVCMCTCCGVDGKLH